MSFGIEFDIGEDDGGEFLSEKETRAREREAARRESSADESHDAASPSGAGDARMREHRFDRLFALTDDIRERDRKRWLRRYASMHVPPQGPAAPSGGNAPVPVRQDEPAASDARQDRREADGNVAAEGDSQGDATEAQFRRPVPGEQAVGTEDGIRDARTVSDAQGAACSTQPNQEPVRQDEMSESADGSGDAAEEVPSPSEEPGAARVLAVSSTALAALAVVLALVPVAGRVLWVVPAVMSVMAAVPALVSAYRSGRSLVLPTVAIFLALAAMVTSAVANQAYVAAGVVSVSQGEAGTTVSVR